MKNVTFSNIIHFFRDPKFVTVHKQFYQFAIKTYQKLQRTSGMNHATGGFIRLLLNIMMAVVFKKITVV